jgi:hypothetical protein
VYHFFHQAWVNAAPHLELLCFLKDPQYFARPSLLYDLDRIAIDVSYKRMFLYRLIEDAESQKRPAAAVLHHPMKTYIMLEVKQQAQKPVDYRQNEIIKHIILYLLKNARPFLLDFNDFSFLGPIFAAKVQSTLRPEWIQYLREIEARQREELRRRSALTIQNEFLRHFAYQKMEKGSYFQNHHLQTAHKRQSFQAVIKSLSQRNMARLKTLFAIGPAASEAGNITDAKGNQLPPYALGPLQPKERAFLEAVLNAPFWLTHYTSQPQKIEKEHLLFSLDELQRRQPGYHPHGAQDCDMMDLKNTFFTFFRLEIGKAKLTSSRFGRHCLLFDAAQTLLFRDGWLSFFDMISIYKTGHGEQLGRRVIARDDSHQIALRYYKKPWGYHEKKEYQDWTVKTEELILHGPHIRLGVALQALFEMRLGDTKFQEKRLQALSPVELAETFSSLFRMEAKIPRQTALDGARWLR